MNSTKKVGRPRKTPVEAVVPEKILSEKLTYENVRGLIEVSGASGVTELRFTRNGDLHVLFGGAKAAADVPAEMGPVLDPARGEADAKRSRETDALRRQDEEEAELLLTNPAEFERRLQDGDLVDEHPGA